MKPQLSNTKVLVKLHHILHKLFCGCSCSKGRAHITDSIPDPLIKHFTVAVNILIILKALAAGQEADNYIIVQASAVVSDNESSEPVSYVFRYANAYITVDGDFNVGHDNQNKRFICGTDRGVLYEEYIGALSDNYSIDRIDNN